MQEVLSFYKKLFVSLIGMNSGRLRQNNKVVISMNCWRNLITWHSHYFWNLKVRNKKIFISWNFFHSRMFWNRISNYNKCFLWFCNKVNNIFNLCTETKTFHNYLCKVSFYFSSRFKTFWSKLYPHPSYAYLFVIR